MAARLEIDGVFTAYDRADVLEGVSLVVEPCSITCLLDSRTNAATRGAYCLRGR
jgi:branched-chain amino acid transport system ATP-binding protein